MNWFIFWYFVIAFASWWLIAGWFFQEVQKTFPNTAEECYRIDLGNAIILGLLYGLLWPFCIFVAWCLTGFAEHGWGFRKRADPPSGLTFQAGSMPFT